MQLPDRTKRAAAVFVGAVGCSVNGLAVAQPSAEGVGTRTALDEIIVTAEKRAERIQDLPIAISSYDGEVLADAGVQGIRDLTQVAPSLNIGVKGAETFITIRGIGSEVASIGSEPGVTVSQDGVVLARHLFFNTDFLDVDRVEVLRGPQGTISGRNATGGAIKVISNLPTSEFEARLDLTGGKFSRFASTGFISGPITGDALTARFAFSRDHSNGWLSDPVQDQDLADRDNIHLRGTLQAEIAPDFTARLTLEGVRDRSSPQSTVNIGRADPAIPSIGEVLGVPDADVDNLVIRQSQRREHKKEMYGASLKLNWDLTESTSLTSTTAYLKLDIFDAQDTDGTLASLGDFPSWRWDLWQFTQEVTLLSDLTDRLDLILGGLFLREGAEQPLEFVATTLGITPGAFVVHPDQDLTSYSAYGQLRYDVTERLRASFGIRYTKDDKEYFEEGLQFVPVSGGADESWSSVTPRFAVDFQASNDVTLYANVSRGFKAGGINTLTLGTNIFEPETVWNYEAGVKASWFDDRLWTNITGFHMDYTNLQQQIYGAGPFGVPVASVINVPDADINGVELEVTARPTEGLTLAASATWLDANLGSFTSVDPADSILKTFSDSDLPRSPEFQYSVSAEYAHPIGNALTGSLRADFSWRDDQFFSIFNNPLSRQESYGLLNLNASIESVSGHWALSAFGTNITDKRYLENGFVSPILPGVPMNLGSIGEPRMYGVTLSYRY